MPVTLRPARLTDAPTLAAIEREVFPDPWSVDAFRSSIRATAARVTVAEAAGEIVGYAVLLAAADEAELANLAVVPETRGRGVGRRLLGAALAAATEAGARAVYLEVRASNTVAQHLYAASGFVPVGRRRGYYRDPDEDALVMRRVAEGATAGGTA